MHRAARALLSPCGGLPMRKAHGRHLRLVGGRPLPMPQGPRLKPAPGGRQTADDAASATRPAADARAVRAAGYEFDGAVMITASHLPYNRNGFKFFTRDGGFEKADIAVLLKAAAAEHAAAEAPNLDPAGAYQDDAFVLSCALHSSPALIEYVRSPCSAGSLCHSCVFPLRTLFQLAARGLLDMQGGVRHRNGTQACLGSIVAAGQQSYSSSASVGPDGARAAQVRGAAHARGARRAGRLHARVCGAPAQHHPEGHQPPEQLRAAARGLPRHRGRGRAD